MNDDKEFPEKVDPSVMPRWLTESYPGMEKDIEGWFTSYYFWRNWNGKEESLTTAKLKARANAQARYKSMLQTESLKFATGKSLWLQMTTLKTGWYKYITEVEDTKEFLNLVLQDKRENDPDSTSIYDIDFILNTLLPTMEKLGVPKENIICIPGNMTKAKLAVPSLRQIAKNNGPEMEQRIVEVMSVVADQKITALEMREEVMPKIMNKEHPKTLQPVTASVCMLPDGRELIIIPSDPAHTRAIEMSTKQIVNGFRYTDPSYLMAEVTKAISPKENKRRKYHANTLGKLSESNNGGVYLPALEHFKDMVLLEYIKHRHYIKKPGVQKLIVEEITFSYNLDNYYSALGYSSNEDAFNAIINMYKPTLHSLSIELPAEDLATWNLKIDLLSLEVGQPAYYLYLELTFGNI